MNVEAALRYAQERWTEAIIVDRDGTILAQAYANGFEGESAHPLFSGTKSFWGAAAVCAVEDGLLALDEPVAETIDTWRRDARKQRVTIRMLLSLTAGFGFGGLGNAVPTYEAALAMPLRDEPGSRFTYGGIALQVFGAVLARKLQRRGSDPHRYLHERVLDPAGARIARWRTLKDGTRPLPTGAFMSARDWLAYGRFMLRERHRFSECFRGSNANPRYGLGWWLGTSGFANDLFYASGSGGQGLYVLPSIASVIVRFGKGASYKHESFLKRLAP